MTEATTTKAGPVINTVTMDDGRIVEFTGKAKLLKHSTIDAAAGTVVTRLDFVNGETRYLNIPQALILRFAAHGAEQKLGDEIAGVKDVEDAIIAIDELLDRLEKGEWNIKREAGGLSGASVLMKALMELSGKSKDEIKSFLAGKSHAEKTALRGNAKLKPIIDRLEAEKAARAKGPAVDTDALLAGLDGAPAEVENQDGAATEVA
jgi:hypothetical protein